MAANENGERVVFPGENFKGTMQELSGNHFSNQNQRMGEQCLIYRWNMYFNITTTRRTF
jgi:hypothetical protein